MELIYKITENDFNKTINEIILKKFNFSNRLITKLIKNKNILLNEKEIDTRTVVTNPGIIKIDFNYDEDTSNIVATKMNLNIIYEDEWIVVVNKPAGCPIHPSRLHFEDSLSNGIKYYFDSIATANTDSEFVICGIAGDYCVKSTAQNMIDGGITPKVFCPGVASIDGGKAFSDFIKENQLEKIV